MPNLSLSTRLTRRAITAALGAGVALAGIAGLPATASASRAQLSIIEDFGDVHNPGELNQFRELGANTVRVILPWYEIAPHPAAKRKPNFNAADPNAYPAANWAPYDALVAEAQKLGLRVDMTVEGGAPRWAEAAAAPPTAAVNLAYVAWRPNAAAFGQFMQAAGKRYPQVHMWALFNEPNFGQDLGPQAIQGSSVATAPNMYRGLVNAGWNALKASGHGRDTILIGEIAAEGSTPHRPGPGAPQGDPGNYGQTRALLFVRDLYCVNSHFRRLTGRAARAAECPTGRASRRFRSQNPGLFDASGFADHPYDYNGSPVSMAGNKVDYSTFQDFPFLERTLDGATRAYGSHKRYAIYNTEYGYITRPPKGRPYPSPATAAYYMNWAEYLSYKQSRVASYMQYLLKDPPATTGVYSGFASGLEFSNGRPKATYAAFQMPVYMPVTSFSHRHAAELWGAARPAPFMADDGDGPQTVSIQLNGRTIRTVTVNGGNGYFDLHIRFPRSGTVRLAYTFPSHDSLLPIGELGKTIHSRSFGIKVH